jgi:hypothetical protein
VSRTGLHAKRESLVSEISLLVRVIGEDDPELSEAVLRLSRSRRVLAPLALCVGAFAMLLDGLKLLLSNWRLLLVQILPALWVWAAMLDLRTHVLHGRSLARIRGPILIPIGLLAIAVTVVSFFLNAVFAFAIAGERPPDIRLAFRRAREHLRPIVVFGCLIGVALAIALTVAPRWGSPWFSVTLGVVVGLMMITYIAVPSRLIGVKNTASRRDKLTASLLSSGLGVTVCTPPYLLGRVGILMLGSSILFVPGLIVVTLGLTLQAGATGAVRAIKLAAALAPATSLPARKTEPEAALRDPPVP